MTDATKIRGLCEIASRDELIAEVERLHAILRAQEARVGPTATDDPLAVALRWNGHNGTREPDFDMSPEDTASFLASHVVELVRERDAYRSALADLVMWTHPDKRNSPHMETARICARELLKNGPVRP